MSEPITQDQCSKNQLDLAERIHSSVSESEIRIMQALNNQTTEIKSNMKLMKLKSAGLWTSIGTALTAIITEIIKHWNK